MKIITFIVFLLLIEITNVFAQSKLENLPWISFAWDSVEVNGRHFDKTAILLPLRISNAPYQFIAQFDLGADLTMFYGNTIKPYFVKCKFLNNKIINEDEYQWFTDASISLDKILFEEKKIFIRKNYGDPMTADSILTGTTKFIGTIGADFVQNKLLIIDYKKIAYALQTVYPKKLQIM